MNSIHRIKTLDTDGFNGLRRIVLLLLSLSAVPARADEQLDYTIELTTASQGYDRKSCWVQARAGAIPPSVPGNPSDTPIVVLTMQKLLLDRSDVYYGLHDLRTEDLGKTWLKPQAHSTLERQRIDEHREIVMGDVTPKWHAATGKLLATGHTVTYYDNYIRPPYDRWTAYSAYDPVHKEWSQWQKLEMPKLPQFRDAGAGCTQRYDLPNGDILLPIYFARESRGDEDKPRGDVYRATVVRCRFDGETLSYVEHGDELAVDTVDGLAEPSLTKFGDRFYLTIRHVERGYVTTSADGLHFEPLREWRFDDGSELGNYNTQQHWVTHSDGLFLIYTRRGANNDHIIRHRAPLFIAQVNPQKLCVIRSTERILVPERGARLGNDGVVDVSPDETWVISAEWMQGPSALWLQPGQTYDPIECEQHGSDNSIFVAKIHWNRPNELMQPGPKNSTDVSAIEPCFDTER